MGVSGCPPSNFARDEIQNKILLISCGIPPCPRCAFYSLLAVLVAAMRRVNARLGISAGQHIRGRKNSYLSRRSGFPGNFVLSLP